MRRRQSFATILVGKSILLREGLARILRSANFRILASVSSADNLLSGKCQTHQPLFLIVHTGADFDAALGQIELFKRRHPDGRVAIVADRYRLGELLSAFRAGANGYFVDVMTCDVFVKSLELVMMGETIFPPSFLSYILGAEATRPSDDRPSETAPVEEDSHAIIVAAAEDALAPRLSPREKIILRCLIEGDSNKCIARKIVIAEATVKVHVKAILRKIRVQNRTQAAIWAMNNGSLTQPTSNGSLLSAGDLSKHLPKSVVEVSEVRQIGTPTPKDDCNHEASSANVTHIDRLIRKSINRTAQETGRLVK
jgi:two-component system nitrate/nitrite response regulator NarL